jgi:ubiquinone/menaquinone biosynthesis C-methylase UbiE
MSRQTMDVWLDAISSHIGHRALGSVLDVGCGAGRFTSALAQRFDANVLGLDPAQAMLAEARKSASDRRVWFVSAAAERLPIGDATISLVFLSMVFHHLRDSVAACREFKRVLLSGGCLSIRTSTVDLLDSVPYLTFFPEAYAHNRARLPSLLGVIETAERAGFLVLKHEVIQQNFAESFSEYREKVSKRALSDLMALPDAEFASGLMAMDQVIARGAPVGAVIEPIDLFTFAA